MSWTSRGATSLDKDNIFTLIYVDWDVPQGVNESVAFDRAQHELAEFSEKLKDSVERTAKDKKPNQPDNTKTLF